jgi:hypothetical protein
MTAEISLSACVPDQSKQCDAATAFHGQQILSSAALSLKAGGKKSQIIASGGFIACAAQQLSVRARLIPSSAEWGRRARLS